MTGKWVSGHRYFLNVEEIQVVDSYLNIKFENESNTDNVLYKDSVTECTINFLT